MANITFPDGNIKSFKNNSTGLDVAKGISEGFARNCVAMELDSEIVDLSTKITRDAKIRFITTKDPEALEILRHSAAHVMAQAILRLYPDARLTIGPALEDDFYYDIDMQPVSKDDFPKIEAEMKKIIKEKLTITRREVSKTEALEFYKNEPYKLEMISELDDNTISFYKQGEFTDLCRGPHIPHTGFVKAIKLMKVSGAYWRADQTKAQLQRIYGTAFFNKKELAEYINFLEEAKKRNHRRIGEAMELFSFHDEAPGMPFIHSKGMVIWNILIDYWRKEHLAAGYTETKTPIMLKRSLWEQSGHWDNYRENMYTSVVDEYDYAIKPMNCPGGMLIYGNRPHSYRELPMRAGEIGLVHRHELSGVLSGLFRVRAFHQDDAHLFMTPDQIQEEIIGVLSLSERIYGTFGLGFNLELSTRPEKSIGTDKGTIQLDMSLPERFDLSYIDRDNEKHRPIMIHRTIFGSIERFFGILIEHFAGKFPLWIAPVQVVILPINDDLAPYATRLGDNLTKSALRVEIDSRTESLNKKIRDAQLNKIPLILTIGKKEKESKTLSVRTLDGSVKYGITHEDFIERVLAHINQRKLTLDIF